VRFPRTILMTAVVALTLALAGCSNSDPESTVDPSKPYNDADVTFATDMIQHHAQALQMIDLTLGKDLDPKVATLADVIRSDQTPEIERMVDLLNEWDKQPIPATLRDHANAHGDGHVEADTSMPGMATDADMAALEKATGADFETKWLTMMIEHHQGAIEMASTEKDQGEDKRATALAADIVTSQREQVNTMQGILDR
jgi:uncharacterized protein (DUF305 family)